MLEAIKDHVSFLSFDTAVLRRLRLIFSAGKILSGSGKAQGRQFVQIAYGGIL
jgi:hypothetical protein